jgi:DNA-binding transcriptional LysR family regulator
VVPAAGTGTPAVNLSRLTHFVAVAEARGFTTAAARLGLGQSTISTSVRRLEEELGATLFVRAPHQGVELTDAGAALLPEARALLAAASRLRDVVGSAGDVMRGTVRFGTLGHVRGVDVVDAMAAFRAAHPAVRLQYHRADTGPGALVELVGEGRLDFAFSVTIREPPQGVRFQTLGTDAYAVLVARDHPLARVGPLTADDLSAVPFVASLPGTTERADLDYQLRTLGVQPRIAFEVNGVGDMLALATRGVGVVLLPEQLAATAGPGVVAAPLAVSLPPCRTVVVTRESPELGGPARLFLEELRDAARASPPPIATIDAGIE